MKCPNCKAKVAETTKKCAKCGYEFSEHDAVTSAVKKSHSFFSFKKKKSSEPVEEPKSKKKGIAVKIGFVVVIVLAIVVVTCIIISAVNANKGARLAEKLAGTIGESIVTAEKESKVVLAEESRVPAANKLMQRQGADYIYESSKKIVVDGVHYPEWLILVVFDEKNIEKVEYYNFSLKEKNYKGEKIKADIDLGQIEVNQKKKDVDNYIDIKPTKTEYTADTIKCTYNYYYINDDDDEEVGSFYITYSAKDERVLNCMRVL